MFSVIFHLEKVEPSLEIESSSRQTSWQGKVVRMDVRPVSGCSLIWIDLEQFQLLSFAEEVFAFQNWKMQLEPVCIAVHIHSVRAQTMFLDRGSGEFNIFTIFFLLVTQASLRRGKGLSTPISISLKFLWRQKSIYLRPDTVFNCSMHGQAPSCPTGLLGQHSFRSTSRLQQGVWVCCSQRAGGW